jgi:hypothetical protein
VELRLCNVSPVSASRILLLTSSLVAWLHLTCGLGREKTTKVLKFVLFLLLLAMKLGAALWAINSDTMSAAHETIGSAMALLSLNPQLTRSVCCKPDNLIHATQSCGLNVTWVVAFL